MLVRKLSYSFRLCACAVKNGYVYRNALVMPENLREFSLLILDSRQSRRRMSEMYTDYSMSSNSNTRDDNSDNKEDNSESDTESKMSSDPKTKNDDKDNPEIDTESKMSSNPKTKEDDTDNSETDTESKMSSNPKTEEDDKDSPEEENEEVLKKMGKFALKTAAVSGVVLGGIALALPILGFTSAGIAAGSVAAAYQSTLGGMVASGSVFATLQSVGAAGLATSTQVGVVAGSAVAVKAGELLKKIKRKNSKANN